MRKRPRALVLTVAVASCVLATNAVGQGPQDRWELVKISVDKSTVMFASRDRQTTDGKVKSIWSLMVYKELRTPDGKEISYSMLKFSFDCRSDTYKTDYQATYAKDDTVVDRSAGSGGFEPIIPESLVDGVAQRSCETKPRSDAFTYGSRAEAVRWAGSYFAR
jgi:hypothetical protein